MVRPAGALTWSEKPSTHPATGSVNQTARGCSPRDAGYGEFLACWGHALEGITRGPDSPTFSHFDPQQKARWFDETRLVHFTGGIFQTAHG